MGNTMTRHHLSALEGGSPSRRHCRRRTTVLASMTVALMTFASCGGDSNSGSGGPTVQATAIFGKVVSTTGSPVGGATITAGARTATSASDGTFQMAATAGNAVVRVTASGHVATAQHITVTENAAAAIELVMLPQSAPVDVDASAGGNADGPSGSRLVLPAGGLVDPDGNAVTGMVQVALTPLNPDNAAELSAAPGGLRATSAGSETVLESFGMIDVTITQDGKELQPASGSPLEVRFPAAGTKPATVPLWSFDEATGLWTEEGTATLDGDHYVASLPHLSFWNADKPLDTTCLSGRTVDADSGEPLGGARVSSRGVDYTGFSATNANADGRWAIPVRKSSQVIILATHADGGGLEKTVDSGSESAPVPPSPDDSGCTDTGDWPVKKGVITLSDGTQIACDPQALSDFSTCSPGMVAIAQCFAPEGECKSGGGGGLFSLNYEFANGSRMQTDIEGTTVTVSYFGPNGAPCGTQTTNASQLTVTTADGQSETVGVAVAANGTVTYTCVDGSSRTITPADAERLSACTNPAVDSCEPGEVDFGSECNGPTDCSDGNACCFPGICIPDSLCSFGSYCQTDDGCGAGMECCGGLNGCAPEGTCDQVTAECQENADCGEGRACCDGSCENRPFCEGECAVDTDCMGTSTVCCPGWNGGDLTWCAADQQACYSGRTCADNSVCGSELSCCERSGTCLTDQGCFESESCSLTSGGENQCGSLECCDRSDFGVEETVCELPVECASYRACTVDTDCADGFGLVCCDRDAYPQPLCVTAENCNLGTSCTVDSDCGVDTLCCAEGVNACFKCDSL